MVSLDRVFSPRAVLFDFGGTLDANGRTWLERARPLYSRLGFRVLSPAFERAFYDADDRLAARHRLEGLDLARVVGLQVQDTLSNLGADPRLAPRIAGPFVEESRARLAASAGLIGRLRTRFKTGIVSNFYGNMASMLEAEGLAGLFDTVADSGRAGFTKPDPRLFFTATDALGLQPGDALMVGDSLSRDMKGAEAAGMPHAWLAGGRDGQACCKDAAVLRRLEDVESLLDLPVCSRA